jgi:hypothetical protein
MGVYRWQLGACFGDQIDEPATLCPKMEKPQRA